MKREGREALRADARPTHGAGELFMTDGFKTEEKLQRPPLIRQAVKVIALGLRRRRLAGWGGAGGR